MQDLRVDVFIYEPQGIVRLSVQEPTLTNSLSNMDTIIDPKSATYHEIHYTLSPERQRLLDSGGKLGDFVVFYDISDRSDVGYIVRNGDYFAHFFSVPEDDLSVLGKNVVFVMDISGSMSGQKIMQTRDAMATILQQLTANDNFAMIFFDDDQLFWPERERRLVQGNGDYVAQARAFALDKLKADGGTGINEALLSACEMFGSVESARGQNTIVFLTDGLPSTGVTDPRAIVANVVEACGGVNIFSLGFGFDVDFELLEKISTRTGGWARRIYDEVDASVQLENFFREIGSPLLYNVLFNYPHNTIDANSLTQTQFPQYFSGSELVVGGKVLEATSNLQVSITANVLALEPAVRSASVDFSDLQVPEEAVAAVPNERFLERLYAYMKIKDLLRSALLTDDVAQINETNQYALRLSLDYHLVTPLTSLLIVEPDQDRERTQITQSGGMQKDDYMNKIHTDMSSAFVLQPSLVFVFASVLSFYF